MKQKYFEIDQASFNPWKPFSFQHKLSDHPLLTLPSLIELAKRHEPKGLIRYHGGHATAATNFETAPTTHATGLSVQETLNNIEKSGSWVAFHFIHRDPIYKELVKSVLDEVRPLIEAHEKNMTNLTGWIFVSSPGAVTPYHLDHEHNFLMQIRGKKRVNVWDPSNRDVVTYRALEIFHANSSRKEVIYTDAIQKHAFEVDAQPGLGVYMPSTAPHWVKNGDDVSITLSVTFTTDATLRKERVYTANNMLRVRGVEPAPYQSSKMKDSLKAAVVGSYIGAKRLAGLVPPAPYRVKD